MPTVREFSSAMVEEYLRSRDLKYLRDSDGDFLVRYAYEDEIGCELNMWLIAGGSSKKIYRVLVRSDKRINRDQWDRTYSLCNLWNKERRWPKAYLSWNEDDDQTGEICLEGQIDLEVGIHQELFNDFTTTVLATAYQFWKWAHQEQRF